MMKIITTLFLLAIVSACEVNVLTYNKEEAAQESLLYLSNIFLEDKVEASYEHIHQSFKDEFSREKYMQVFSEAAEANAVESIQAERYEYVGGEIGEMHIYFSIMGATGSGVILVKLAGPSPHYQVFGVKSLEEIPLGAKFNGEVGQFEAGKFKAGS